ncbi:MAG: hypothetical protein ABI870_12370 [Rhodanobacter sp.]
MILEAGIIAGLFISGSRYRAQKNPRKAVGTNESEQVGDVADKSAARRVRLRS